MSVQEPSVARGAAVAIVDDDASVRVSLRRLCVVFGLSATAYASGGELLAALDSGAPRIDCLLLDAQMPGMNGLELRRHLVARGERIPTIVITAGDVPEGLAQDADPDIVGYLRKPFSATDLLAVIEQALGARAPAP